MKISGMPAHHHCYKISKFEQFYLLKYRKSLVDSRNALIFVHNLIACNFKPPI